LKLRIDRVPAKLRRDAVLGMLKDIPDNTTILAKNGKEVTLGQIKEPLVEAITNRKDVFIYENTKFRVDSVLGQLIEKNYLTQYLTSEK